MGLSVSVVVRVAYSVLGGTRGQYNIMRTPYNSEQKSHLGRLSLWRCDGPSLLSSRCEDLCSHDLHFLEACHGSLMPGQYTLREVYTSLCYRLAYRILWRIICNLTVWTADDLLCSATLFKRKRYGVCGAINR